MTTTLLAVDDSKTMRKVLEITFAGEDYRTVLAESSADALAKLRSDNPAVALVDANLGEENGYELCQKLKREAPSVGVLILSSKQQPYDRARGSSAGADDFIDKPFDTQQLIDKVGALARKAAGESPSAARAAVPSPAAAVAARPAVPIGGARPAVSGNPVPAQATKPAAIPLSPARPAASASTGMGVAAARPGVAARAPGSSPIASPQPVGRPPSAPRAAPPPAVAAALGAVSRPQPSSPAVVSPVAPVIPATAVVPPTPSVGRPAVPAAPISPSSATAGPPVASVPLPAAMEAKLQALGLTKEQVDGVLALSKEVVEQVVWEVVPTLAEVMIREEIRRLTSEP